MPESESSNNSNGDAAAADSAQPPHSPENSVEKAFELLKEAKSLEAEQEFWKASAVYVQAKHLLQALADEAERNQDDGGDTKKKEEQEQIAKLYSEKAQEYWSQSRQCLIQAMELEKKGDEEEVKKKNSSSENSSPMVPSCNLIDDGQARARNQTFSVLFSRPLADETLEEAAASNTTKNEQQQDDKTENIMDQQWSIEERLQELNKSLPSGFKTDEERIKEINKGLGKLGLSLPHTQKAPFARFQDTLPKSEEDQIEDIMAQAQDEAAFEAHHARMSGGSRVLPLAETAKTDDDDDLSDDDDDDVDTEAGDELLEDDQLAIKQIRKRVVKAQIKIAELVALLDEAKAAKDKEYADEKAIDRKAVLNDDDSADEGKSDDAATYLVPGKKKLKSAQRDLRKVMEEWNDATLLVVNRKQSTDDTRKSPVLMAANDDEEDDDDEAPELIALDDEDLHTRNDEGTEKQNIEETTASLPACPVTILSGFLGSGKTTLVQYILKSPDHGKRIAVIENEFGEGLAVESLIARDGLDPNSDSLQDLIELPNGCICCTVKDSLVTTLEALLDKRNDLDYILIEASGMANPGPIASVFWLDDALESRLKLDGIVTLVDGVHIMEQLESTEEAAQQIAYADRIILNKVDLLEHRHGSESGTKSNAITTAKVESRLRELHPSATILRTSFSKIPDLDWILNADCFGGADRLEELENIWGNAVEKDDGVGGDEGHDHTHHHDHDHDDGHDCNECRDAVSTNKHVNQHKHTASISTIALHEHGSVDLAKLNAWLADILWPNQDQTDEFLTAMLHDKNSAQVQPKRDENEVPSQQIFRIKGIVSAFFRDEDEDDPKVREAYLLDCGLDRRRFIIQAVHDLWECYPASDELLFETDEERVGKVVVIGKFLKEEELKAGFKSCFREVVA